MATYYAAPGATGNRLTIGTPGSIRGFTQDATQCAAGNSLELADGTYNSGINDVIQTVAGRGGSGPGAGMVTIYAKNEGQVLIDGTDQYNTCIGFAGSNYYNIVGINFTGSLTSGIRTGVSPTGSNHSWLVQRCGAWDNAQHGTSNDHNIAIEYSTDCIVEDCFAFGGARKTFNAFDTAGPNTFRRCFGLWNESTTQGPKQGMSFTYHAYQTLVENCIFAWDSHYMPSTYLLGSVGGPPISTFAPTGSNCGPGGVTQADGTCLFSNKIIQNNNYGPLAHDNTNQPSASYSVFCRIYGTIVYGISQTTGDYAPRLVFQSNLDQVEYKDVIAFYPNDATFASIRTFDMFKGTATGTGLSTTNCTSFYGTPGGVGYQIQTPPFVNSNLKQAQLPANLYTLPNETMYNTTQGASILNRYVDGVLTGTPLWPWPMNQRILDAMGSTSYTPVDVNATIQAYFGDFPAATPPGVWFTS